MVDIKKMMMEAETPEALYMELWNKYLAGRPGAAMLLLRMKETGFFNAPASAKRHLAEPGGLVKHSVNVALAAVELCEGCHAFAECDVNAVVVAALLHDLCKIGLYVPTGNPQKPYSYSNRASLGHGEESVIMALNCTDLNDCEIAAIRWHMGAYTGERNWNALDRIYNEYPEALCLHFADMIAAHYDEK